METGIIERIDRERGLGYVITPQGEEIVLIALGMEAQLKRGMQVDYNIRQTRVGLIAVDVVPHVLHGRNAA